LRSDDVPNGYSGQYIPAERVEFNVDDLKLRTDVARYASKSIYISLRNITADCQMGETVAFVHR
jgi:hypothetical protein